MIRWHVCFFAIALAPLYGCASAVDVPPARGISQDISATHALGPSSLRPGRSQSNNAAEPAPWRLEEQNR